MQFDAKFLALVALVIFLLIAAKAGAFSKLTSGLDNRADRIRKELEHATQLRKDAEALLAEYKQKRLDAEKEAASIISAAKSDAEEFAAETRRKLTESLERRSKQAEQKIAQAEAAARQTAVVESFIRATAEANAVSQRATGANRPGVRT